MFRTLFILFLFQFCLYAFGGLLQLNPAATRVRDVNVIRHTVADREVIVVMKEIRTCKEPVFVVRLSGTSIYVLSGVTMNSTSTFHFVYPTIVDAGIYFLEVLLLQCELAKPNNFAHQCLEDPKGGRNVLTLSYSFTVNASLVYEDHLRPRWVWKPPQSHLLPSILHTRYQQNNMGDEAKNAEQQQVNSYYWVGAPDTSNVVRKVLQMNSQAPVNDSAEITFCLVGASHARYLSLFGTDLKIPGVRFFHVDSRFPFQFDAEHHLMGCSYAVLGYGQWPLGWVLSQVNKVYQADKYEAEMNELFRRLQQVKTSTQVFTRSMNYNGYFNLVSTCPPKDHRSRQVVDIYNVIMRNLSAIHNVSFIDTTAIQSPMWDGGNDYRHPNPNVFTAEIEHIMVHALSHSLQHQRAPVLVPTNAPRGARNILVKFTGSDKVYLYAGGVMHGMVDEILFRKLGYYFEKKDQVRTFDASTRHKYKFAPDFQFATTIV